MSDFLTRLVERQAGTVAMVQPRISSKFAPPASRTGQVDLPVIDSPSQIEQASRTPEASVREGDDRSAALIQTDRRERQQPVPQAPFDAHAAGEPRRAESAPAPLIRNASTVMNRKDQAGTAAPPIDPATIHKPAARRQSGLGGQEIDNPVDPVSILAPRMEPPPRLVASRRDTPRSSPTAPPTLTAGTVMERRTEPTHAVLPEALVEVTIGRIEVTAVSVVPDQKRKSTSRRPAMSLEDYLTRRQGGRP